MTIKCLVIITFVLVCMPAYRCEQEQDQSLLNSTQLLPPTEQPNPNSTIQQHYTQQTYQYQHTTEQHVLKSDPMYNKILSQSQSSLKQQQQLTLVSPPLQQIQQQGQQSEDAVVDDKDDMEQVQVDDVDADQRENMGDDVNDAIEYGDDEYYQFVQQKEILDNGNVKVTKKYNTKSSDGGQTNTFVQISGNIPNPNPNKKQNILTTSATSQTYISTKPTTYTIQPEQQKIQAQIWNNLKKLTQKIDKFIKDEKEYIYVNKGKINNKGQQDFVNKIQVIDRIIQNSQLWGQIADDQIIGYDANTNITQQRSLPPQIDRKNLKYDKQTQFKR